MTTVRNISKCEIVLTRNCNMRCKFCFEKKDGYSNKDQINLDNLKKIVDFCFEAKTKYIFLTGGEPLLYPHLIDILLYIQSRNYPVETAIATNGILLADTLFCKKLIDSGMKYVDISMKGKDSKEWIKETGIDGFEKQRQAIHNLSRLAVEFTCSMVVTLDNVYSVCERVQRAWDCGARQFSFTFFIDNEDSPQKGIKYLEKHNPYLLINAFLAQSDRISAISDD